MPLIYLLLASLTIPCLAAPIYRTSTNPEEQQMIQQQVRPLPPIPLPPIDQLPLPIEPFPPLDPQEILRPPADQIPGRERCLQYLDRSCHVRYDQIPPVACRVAIQYILFDRIRYNPAPGYTPDELALGRRLADEALARCVRQSWWDEQPPGSHVPPHNPHYPTHPHTPVAVSAPGLFYPLELLYRRLTR